MFKFFYVTFSADEYFKELQPVPLHMKRESQVPKYLNLVNKGGGAQGLERALGQLMRIMSKAQVFDFQCFLLMDGLGALATNVIAKSMQEDSEVSKKCVIMLGMHKSFLLILKLFFVFF